MTGVEPSIRYGGLFVTIDAAKIRLTSILPPHDREELEEVFFFNPKQPLVRSRVLEHIERYGPPEIVEQAGGITLALRGIDQAQTIFLMDGNSRSRLLAAVIYIREEERLKVLYLAMKHACCVDRSTSHTLLLYVVRTLIRLGKQIKGIHFLDVCVGPRDAVFKV
jgi:hypothetical protein